jgi:metallophosphoesterase superfamily enzyme
MQHFLCEAICFSMKAIFINANRFFIVRIFFNENNFSMQAIQQSPKHYRIIIIGDFNVDILKDNNQPKKKQELFISWIKSN